MDSFDVMFAAVLERESAPKETPFEDALHAWDAELSRSLPKEPPSHIDWTARPVWAETLGVALPCTQDDVKRAFRRAAFEAHPDRGGSNEAFRNVQEAFEAARREDGAFAGRPLPFVTARYESVARAASHGATVARAA